MSSRIRIGFVGLSAKSGWAKLAHWPYLKKSPHYQITAVLNSSVESGKAAISELGLDPSTKAYGSAEDLAKDDNVDLVVVSVRVDQHFAPAKAVIMGKKDVFVEWPLGSNSAEAQELANLANEKGVKTAIGLQGRLDPLQLKIREVIKSGKIGQVLSSTTDVVADMMGPTQGSRYGYMVDAKVGGNLLTIAFAHCKPTFLLYLIVCLQDFSLRPGQSSGWTTSKPYCTRLHATPDRRSCQS
jgi:predicted dehydrogenase